MNDKNVSLELSGDESKLLQAIVMKAQIVGEIAPMVTSILSKLAQAQLATEKEGK